ncbi:uncharacterized protein AB9X84_007229 [Acanthopagrus schlegelii]
MMGSSLISICLMTASVSLLSVKGNKEGSDYIPKTSNSGDTVQIDCPYPESHESNEKFLCKGEKPSDCKKLIQTTEQDRSVSEGRLAIRDNQRVKYFYVTIKNVNTADSGTYWCGSDTTSRRILLSVAESITNTRISTRDPDEDDGPPERNKSIIGGVVGSLAFILVVVIVVLVVRHKFPGTQVCCAAGGSSGPRINTQHDTEGNHGDHNFEEIQIQNQQASSGDALQTVYATVNPPADQLFYASVNFPSDSVNVGNVLPGTDSNGSSACEYSSISMTQEAIHPPAAEQTIYTTVTKPGKP